MAATPPAKKPETPATPPAPIDPVTDILGGGRTVAFRVDLALAVGSIAAGLLLSQFWFWTNSPTTEKRDGWFWMTCPEISEQTGLSKDEQMTARKRLRSLGILEEDKRGVPMKLWFRIRKPELVELLRGYAIAKAHLSGFPIVDLSGNPTDGEADSLLSGSPKDNVGKYRHIARGKANGLLSGSPEDITETSSPISSPISLDMSSEAAQAPPGAPSHKCDPQGDGEPDSEGEPPAVEDGDDLVAFYWLRTLRRLEGRVNKPTYQTHLWALQAVSLEEADDADTPGSPGLTFTLSAPSDFTRRWIRDRHLPTIQTAIEEEIGQPVTVRLIGAGAEDDEEAGA